MGEHKETTVDARLAAQMSGRDKLRALITAQFGTIQNFAREHSLYPEQVTMTLSGERPYPDVRQIISQVLVIPRSEVDSLIDEKAGSLS